MKKLLSIILAIAMIAAMLPSAFAADSFEGYKYVFTNAALGSPNSNFTRTPLSKMTLETPDSSLSHQWKVAGSNNLTNVYAQPEGIIWNGYTGDAQGASTFAIEIWVPNGGTYKPSLNYSAILSAPKVDVYLVKEETEAGDYSTDDIKFATNESDYDSTSSFINALGDDFKLGQVDLWGGSTTTDYENIVPENFNDLELPLDANSKYYLCFRTAGLNDGHKGVSNGTYFYVCLESFKLTPVQDEALTEAFKPENSVTEEDYSEPTVISITKDGKKIESFKNSDGTHNITAPEKNEAGKKFLYWAKGLSAQKRILIGKTNVLTNYVPDSKYANYLIPVYEDEVSGTEYYNANGQLIPNATENDRPSMAGYGTATGWDTYGANIRVAHYDLAEPEANIDITVTGGTGTGKYAFGDTVTCRANGSGTFKCWTKSDIYGATDDAPEIVSCDPEYTFKAWEGCTVTAVYADHHYTGEKMKVIIDTFDVVTGITGVMAEFIGLDNAVEKGIMFTKTGAKEATKIAMTTVGNQFSVIADENGTYEGYAVIKEEDDTYTLITDGKYTKSAEAE